MVSRKDTGEMNKLWIYIGTMSVLLFLVMGWDKLSAVREKRRIPEATLFLMAAIGGAPGGLLGMISLRHKIRTWYFWAGFLPPSLSWVGGLIWLIVSR